MARPQPSPSTQATKPTAAAERVDMHLHKHTPPARPSHGLGLPATSCIVHPRTRYTSATLTFLDSGTAAVEVDTGAEAAEQRLALFEDALFGCSKAPSLASLQALRALGVECERLHQALSRALLALHVPDAVAASATTTSQAPSAPPEASFTNELELLQLYRITYLTLGLLQLEPAATLVPNAEISPHAARLLMQQLGASRPSGDSRGGEQVARCTGVLCKLGADAASAPLAPQATRRAALGSAFALCLRASLDWLLPAGQHSDDPTVGMLASPPPPLLTDEELLSIFTDLGSSIEGFSEQLRAQTRAHLVSQLEQARAHAPHLSAGARLS